MFRGMLRHFGQSARKHHFEALEERTVLTTTLFLDFGGGIGMGNTLSTTAAGFRDIFGANTGTNMTNGTNAFPGGLAAGDSLDFTPLNYDFDLDGNTNNADITALAAAVVPVVQRALEPFDINVVTAAAATFAAADTLVDANIGDPTGEFDAYVFVTTITSDGFAMGSNAVGARFGLFGRAALIDLGAQTGNNTDEASLTFADNVFTSVSGTIGTPAFNQNLATRLAYTATHEAFHTFSNRHAPDESTTNPQASNVQRLLASGDVIRRGSVTRENPFMVTRYDLLRGIVVAEPNNYLLAANDPDIGLRDVNTNGTPDFAYSTGTGANDQLTYTDGGGGIVNVVVSPFSNQSRSFAIGAGENYTIDLATDTEGEILIDAGINADEVVLDATINASFRARGGIGSDSSVAATADQDLLTLNSGGLAGTFTPDPGDPTGVNGNVTYAGGAVVDFSEFEDVNADNVSIDTIDLTLSSTTVDENVAFSLDVEFVNIDTLDSHKVVVDWGNGEMSMTTLGAGIRDTTFNYTYPDDHPASGTISDLFNIQVTITDDDDDTGIESTNITVENVAPEITSIVLSDNNIDEGDSVTVTGAFTDPALTAMAATESWSGTALWSDGVATVVTVNQAAGTFETMRTFLDDHPLTGTPFDLFTVDITITDDDVGTDTETSAAVTVNNLDPILTSFSSDATFDNKGEEGVPINIMGSFTDVGILDTHTAEVDWGDGSPLEMVTVNQGAGLGTITGSHAYMFGGIYNITVTLTDDDTGTDTAMTIAVITGAGIQNGVLQIIGSNENDHVFLEQSGGQFHLEASFINGPRQYALAAVDSVLAMGCMGRDHIEMDRSVNVRTRLLGGKGHDVLIGGNAEDVLVGGRGNDWIFGFRGRDVLIGGKGRDELLKGRDNLGNLIIAGLTDFDDDVAALDLILDEWSGPGSRKVRSDNLLNGDGALMGSGIALEVGVTVFDDGQRDKIIDAENRARHFIFADVDGKHGDDDREPSRRFDRVIDLAENLMP